jgi:tetratricopeptide (TPR) repeat protein
LTRTFFSGDAMMNSPRVLYDQLARILDGGNPREALQQVRRICAAFEDDGGAWELRGLLEAEIGQPESAVRSFERAGLLVPLEPWSSRVFALQYVAIGRRELGVDLLSELGRSGLLETGLIRLVSQDLVKLGFPERSAEVLRRALRIDPCDAMLWHERAAIEAVLGESPEACLALVTQAIELMPERFEFRVTGATLLIRMNQVLEAYQLVREFVTPDGVALDCPCCLWRLIHLFNCFDDEQRVRICYRRLAECVADQL